MLIGIIARGLTRGGVTRYIESILSWMNAHPVRGVEFVIFTDEQSYKARFPNLTCVYFKSSSKIIWDYVKILPYLFRSNVDVVLYPKNIIPFTHLIFRFKKVNVIHDLAYFEKGLNEYKLFDTVYMRAFMKLSCNLADRVIAVSNFTKRDIVDRLSIDERKIEVVHEGVDESFKPILDREVLAGVLSKYEMQSPYILYCGSLSPRKNILNALKAFNEIKDSMPHHFYLAGGQSWHDKEVLDYISLHLSDRVKRVGFISEGDLLAIYTGASLFMYPSLYEGFGLPILEAQACGCPVITSDRASCPEVAGEGACIVDPLSVPEIKSVMMRLISDETLANNVKNAGFRNLERFSWRKTTESIMRILIGD